MISLFTLIWIHGQCKQQKYKIIMLNVFKLDTKDNKTVSTAFTINSFSTNVPLLYSGVFILNFKPIEFLLLTLNL